MIIYKNIDYLTIALTSKKSLEYFKGFVENNWEKEFFWEYSLSLKSNFEKVKIINLYSSRVKKRDWRVWFIRIVYWESSQAGVKLELSWTYFTHHSLREIYEFFQFFEVSTLLVYRLDYCIDKITYSPQVFFDSKNMQSLYSKPIRTNQVDTTEGRYLNWFSMLFSEFSFRVYDKLLDISPAPLWNWKIDFDPVYSDYKKYSTEYVTRFEISLNRDILKKMEFFTIEDLQSTWEKKLSNFISKYFSDIIEVPRSTFIYKRKEKILKASPNINLYYATIEAYIDKLRNLYIFWETDLDYIYTQWETKKVIQEKLLKLHKKLDKILFPNFEEN